MSTIAKMTEWLSCFQQERDQWPDDYPAVDLEDELHRWATGYAWGRIENPYLIDHWVGRINYGPLPVGEQAIREHPQYRHWPRLDREELAALALMAGDEYLDVVVRGVINGNQCEVFFLWQRQQIDSVTFDYRPVDPAFRITARLGAGDDTTWMKNIREWWRERAALPNPKAGGAPRHPITYEIACELWLELHELGQATYITLADALEPVLGRTVHQKTISRRVKEWKKQGLQWPPLPDQ